MAIFTSRKTGEIWTTTSGANPVRAGQEAWINCVGAGGEVASTPHLARYTLTGDLQIIAKIAPADWNPASQVQNIIAKRYPGASSFQMRIGVGGSIEWVFTRGAVSTFMNSSVTLASAGAVNGQPLWVMLTWDRDNGAGGNTTTIYTSKDGVNWTMLGIPLVTTGTATLDASGTSMIEVGNAFNGSHPIGGKVFQVELRDALSGGNRILSFNADDAPLAANFSDTMGQTIYAGGVVTKSPHQVQHQGVQLSAGIALAPVVPVANGQGASHGVLTSLQAEASLVTV